jgi:hypothetical protein
MMQLLTLFDCGTDGTHAEPTRVSLKVFGKSFPVQSFTAAGTRGTRGTLQSNRADVRRNVPAEPPRSMLSV